MLDAIDPVNRVSGQNLWNGLPVGYRVVGLVEVVQAAHGRQAIPIRVLGHAWH